MRLAASLLLATACLCRASEPAVGRWQGTIQIPGVEIPVVIDLDKSAAGHWTGSAIITGFDVKGAPLADLTLKDSA